ncbi:MAG: hypothetical protein ACK4NF_02980 [Planctomycetota bacterium]
MLPFLIALVLGLVPYAGWGFIFYLFTVKKIRSPLIWITIFLSKLFLISAIIYFSRNIIVANPGYFFLNFSLINLFLPVIVNKILIFSK